MPELPEVETVCQGLQCLTNKRFKKIIVRQPSLRWPIPKTALSKLIGQPIQQITRRAKYLLIKTPHGTLIIHLGMSGVLRLHKTLPETKKHDHVDFIFNGIALRYTDPRRFGAILFHAENSDSHFLLKGLGPEPLTDDFNPVYLFNQSRNKKVAIKNFIMDSHVVSGVGNIYAAEALFLAKIHPAQPTGTIDLTAAKQLCQSIKRILRQAIKAGGTTLKDFQASDGRPGYFTQNLLCYGRDGLPCQRCQTILLKAIIGQRASVFCPQCQRLADSLI